MTSPATNIARSPRAELGERGLALVGAATGDDDLGALGQERRGDAFADALCAAGDDRDLVLATAWFVHFLIDAEGL